MSPWASYISVTEPDRQNAEYQQSFVTVAAELMYLFTGWQALKSLRHLVGRLKLCFCVQGISRSMAASALSTVLQKYGKAGRLDVSCVASPPEMPRLVWQGR